MGASGVRRCLRAQRLSLWFCLFLSASSSASASAVNADFYNAGSPPFSYDSGLLRENLLSTSSCSDSLNPTIHNYDATNKLNHSWFCTSTLECALSSSPSSVLPATPCVFRKNGRTKKGICCRSSQVTSRPDKTSSTNVASLSNITLSEGIFETFEPTSSISIYRRGQPIMDRGHMFQHPWHYPQFTPVPSRGESAHPPLPTHPPQMTNKPWWVSQKVTTRVTKLITPPWQWLTPTTAPKVTKRWWRATTKENNKNKFNTKPTTTRVTQKPESSFQSYCRNDISTNENNDGKLKITGGAGFAPHLYPWMALIYVGAKHVCGGSLIDEQHILTAAHCVASLTSWQKSSLRVVLGAHYLQRWEPSRQELRVKTVVRHKEYSRTLLLNDIAILTLAAAVRPSTEVRPICIYEGQDQFAKTEAIVAGWGSQKEGGHQLETPRHVTLRIHTNTHCADVYGRTAPAGVVPSYLCAGSIGQDACSGDSGGPIFKRIRGAWRQIGVVSWGIGCGRGPYPGVYSRMSHFLPWVKKVVHMY